MFAVLASMQADTEAGNFLEASTVAGSHGQGMFGISFDAVRNVAATGEALVSTLLLGNVPVCSCSDH